MIFMVLFYLGGVLPPATAFDRKEEWATCGYRQRAVSQPVAPQGARAGVLEPHQHATPRFLAPPMAQVLRVACVSHRKEEPATNRHRYKVPLEVRYRDKAGQWKGTNSLALNEIPKAILALQKAYEYLMDHREAPSAGPNGSEGGKPPEWRETLKA